MYSGSGLKV